MSETSDDGLMVKHYKKRLIQLHHTPKFELEHNSEMMIQKINPKTLAPMEVTVSLDKENLTAKRKMDNVKDESQVGDLKKRRQSRTQFKYNDMEFIKLGDGNSSNTLCKSALGKSIIKSGELTKSKPDEVQTRKNGETVGRHNLPQIVPQMGERKRSVDLRVAENKGVALLVERKVEEVPIVIQKIADGDKPVVQNLKLSNSPEQIAIRRVEEQKEPESRRIREDMPILIQKIPPVPERVPDVIKINAVNLPVNREMRKSADEKINNLEMQARSRKIPNTEKQKGMDLSVDHKKTVNENSKRANLSIRVMPTEVPRITQPFPQGNYFEQFMRPDYHQFPIPMQMFHHPLTCQQIEQYNRIYPLTPEASPTNPQQFAYHPRTFNHQLRPILSPPQPVKPVADNMHMVKRPRGRPRLHNVKPKKPPLLHHLISPPNTPITNAPFDLSQRHFMERTSPEKPKISNITHPQNLTIQRHKPTKLEVIEVLSESEDHIRTPPNKKREEELDKYIENTKHVRFTPESFSRMRLIYSNLGKTVLDKKHSNETHKDIINFNGKLIQQFQETFLSYCEDHLIKQLIPQCTNFFRKFIHSLMVNSKPNGSWSYLGQIKVEHLDNTGPKDYFNLRVLKKKCSQDPEFFVKKFRLTVFGEGKLNEDIIFSTKQPSIIIIMDKFGNYVETTYSTNSDILSVKCLELIVLNESCSEEMRKKKERFSISSDDHSEKMTDQISNIIDALDEDDDRASTSSVKKTQNKTKDVDDVIVIDVDELSKEEPTAVVTSTSSSHSLVVEDISDEESTSVKTPPVYIKLLPKEKLESSPTHKLPTNYVFDPNDIPLSMNGVQVQGRAVESQTSPKKKPPDEIITSTRDISRKEKQLKSSVIEKIPKGKLCYIRNKYMLLRYFDNAQANLFFENLEKSKNNETSKTVENEIINLPPDVEFSTKETLGDVQEYLAEYSKVQAHAPDDFFSYYKYVTGYQIYKRNIPISFQTFLTMHNTNGLKKLMVSYIDQLERQDMS